MQHSAPNRSLAMNVDNGGELLCDLCEPHEMVTGDYRLESRGVESMIAVHA
jgi:hypothetical protein